MPTVSDYFGTAIGNHLLRNQAFTPPTTIYLALHNGDPGRNGANEITGGSYARQTITLPAFSSRVSNWTGTLNFASMPNGDVMAASLWDAATSGNNLMNGPLNGGSFTAVASTDVFTASSHGMANGDKVAFCPDTNLTLPTGITAYTTYYVINTATNTFQISTTPGGSAVNLTADGAGKFIKVKGLQTGDTFQLTSLPVSFD